MDLPHNILLYIFLLIALAIGYLFGRKERERPRPQSVVIKDYYQGLNFLLGERPELGVDRFIEVMAVTDETIDVHLALASVVRRRGEVDKAIRIHQNLMANPVLSSANKQLVEFELARDYHVAGLLGRAEGLLVEIVARRDAQQTPAVELLLDLYEQEKEWQKAIDVSKRLTKTSQSIRQRVCHLHCELADNHLSNDSVDEAKKHIRKAFELDNSQPRGHWLAARADSEQKKYRRVVRHLARATELQPALLAEFLPLLRNAYENLEADAEYERYLSQAVQRHPEPRVLKSLVEFRRKNGMPWSNAQLLEGVQVAPSQRHIPMLLEMVQCGQGDDVDRAIQQLQEIVQEEERHQCGNCGFTSHHHIWHCPTCKGWGTFGH
ncbi:MAG: hypothetical protein GXP16_19770 [Gammaproteobacteria bacterium]|nr:hypothetical protein [Gammaproteobacteria bacterium]